MSEPTTATPQGVAHLAAGGGHARGHARLGQWHPGDAVYQYAPEKVLTRRLLDRASEGGRADDRANVIRHRLQVFSDTTGPLVPYYKERGILITVDADQPPESVAADIQAGLSVLSPPLADSDSSR